jgi:hypothetical protein
VTTCLGRFIHLTVRAPAAHAPASAHHSDAKCTGMVHKLQLLWTMWSNVPVWLMARRFKAYERMARNGLTFAAVLCARPAVDEGSAS